MRGSVLDPDKMIIVGEVHRFSTIKNLIIQVIVNKDSSVVSGWLSVALLTVADTVQATVVLIRCLFPHPVHIGHGGEEDVHHDLLPRRVLPVDNHIAEDAPGAGAGSREANIRHNLGVSGIGEVDQLPGVGGLAVRVAVEGAPHQEQEADTETGAGPRHFQF